MYIFYSGVQNVTSKWPDTRERRISSLPSPLLHQNTRSPGKMFCYFFERVFVRRFPVMQANAYYRHASVVMRSLTSACSRRSRFTVVETSPVNERTFQSCSCRVTPRHRPCRLQTADCRPCKLCRLCRLSTFI